MQKRPLSFSYILFYLLLSEDTWRIVAGFVIAVILGPMLSRGQNLGRGGETMLWLMLMAIGWALTAWPARKICGTLQRAVKRAAR